MLFGTASKGGSANGGTVFKLSTNGTGFMVLRSLSGGAYGGLTLAGNTLYGTTYRGGVGQGAVFKLNTDGTGYSELKQFSGSDGASPQCDLLLVGDTLYGTTLQGGSSYYGIFVEFSGWVRAEPERALRVKKWGRA
jgi:uncharacterized repeat protein (TIGR03803 family)